MPQTTSPSSTTIPYDQEQEALYDQYLTSLRPTQFPQLLQHSHQQQNEQQNEQQNSSNLFSSLTSSATLSNQQQVPQQIHLDHAASTLYPNQLIQQISHDLMTHLYANPHSQSSPALSTAKMIQDVRRKILKQLFHTDLNTYSVIFTHNATASCKLVGETFPFGRGNSSSFVYMMSNHNSVLGIRELATEKGATSICLTMDDHSRRINSGSSNKLNSDEDGENEESAIVENLKRVLEEKNKQQNSKEDDENVLFAFSPECNSTGQKLKTNLVGKIHRQFNDHNTTKNSTTTTTMAATVENTTNTTNNSTNFRKQNKKSQVYVLMDISKYVCSNVLDLSRSENQADFIAFSIYKLFGYPMGLGVLLVKNSSAHVLRKSYFGGGTVSFAISNVQKHELRPVLHEAFEDGTVPYLNILALDHALDMVPHLITDHGRFTQMMTENNGNNETKVHFLHLVQRHTFHLAQYAYEQLSQLRHSNGQPVCTFYGNHHLHDASRQGSIVNFNLKRSNGHYVGYGEVSQASSIHSPQINLRTGCFCNPGSCQLNLGLSADQMLDNYRQGHVCWDGNDVMSGEPTGSVRVSFGWMSVRSDVDALVSFIKQYFVETENETETEVAKEKEIAVEEKDVENGNDEKVNLVGNGSSTAPKGTVLPATLTQLIIYPVKSCQGISVDHWQMTDSGPIYDREWTIVDHYGQALQQKLHPRMACIHTDIDLESRTLILSDARDKSSSTLRIPLDYYPEETKSSNEDLKVCGFKTKGLVYTDEHISEWLSTVLDTDVRLVRKNPNNDRYMVSPCGRECAPTAKINFSNEAQFLLITRSSIDDLNRRLKQIYWSSDSVKRVDYSGCCYANSDWLITRFRPNLVIENANCAKPYEEDNFTSVDIAGQLKLTVAGQCNRCSMICVDPIELVKVSEPLKTMFGYRRNEGKVLFGVLLSMDPSSQSHYDHLRLSVGSRVLCHVSK